jgi:ABC-type Fe3+ transport system substrate-binding protein
MNKAWLGLRSLILLILVFVFLPLALGRAQPVPASAPIRSPFAQVIEGAKKEGTVSVNLAPTLKQTSIERMTREIKAKYGVDLSINFTPMSVMPRLIAQAVMEHKAGATPPYDLMTITENEMIPYIQAGAGQKVDWKPLAPEAGVPVRAIMGVSPELEMLYGYGLVYYSSHIGLMYNPKVVSPSEVPKKLSDLASLKWKGILGIRSFTTPYARLSYFLGQDYILNSLQAIMKTKPIVDTQANLASRFRLGEISMSYIISEKLGDVKRSTPAEWQSLEVSAVSHFYTSVRVGAPHPNAAKLVALYLASPEGYRLMAETAGAGNMLYPGNTEYDIDQQDKAQGLRLDGAITDERLWKFMSSNEFQELSKKIDMIFKGG